MKKANRMATVAAVISLVLLGAASVAAAQESGSEKRVELSLMGGVQALSENDTGIPDNLIDVPTVASVSYRLTPIWALEGEFTWMIPVTQSVDLGNGSSQDMKTPDILAYQANVRASWPVGGTPWKPYLAAGAGGVSFLSNTDADRVPALDKSQTMFAMNFGGGVGFDLSPSWGLRGDFREFVAFPSNDTPGFSSDGNADQVWMARGTVGVAYRF